MNTSTIIPGRRYDLPLPILPRSCGVNRFRKSGLLEDLEPIDAVEICTVARGECEIEQRGEAIRLSAGDSLYKLPGEHRRKRVLSADGAVIYWVTFRGAYATEFIESYEYPTGALPTGRCPTELYDEISRNLILGTDSACRRTVALIAELIALLPGPDREPKAADRIIAELLQVIRTRFHDPDFNVDSLAEASKLHRTTLLRLFRKHLNTTPVEYLTRCRLDHARHLLRTTLLPVADIAESSGFRQCSYFCKVIRESCGKTPEQYRREF